MHRPANELAMARTAWTRSRAVGLIAAVVLASALLHPQVSASSRRAQDGVVDGLELVATVPNEKGTHLERATIKGRDYVFASTSSTSLPAELRVIDVTTPARPRVVALVHCGIFQGNLQLSHDKKTLILGVDTPAPAGACIPPGEQGFVTIDISKPKRPRAIGYAVIPGGSHSTAAHPTKPLVYNAPEGSPQPDRNPPELEVWSIADPAKPRLVSKTPMPGVNSPHDISFSRDGSMAATANISAFHLLDTSDPAKPSVEFTGQCPGCQHTHEARFTADGKTLVVNDEAMVPAYPCPGGALYFYDVVESGGTHAAELTGAYTPSDVGVTAAGSAGFCTPHVFDISRDGTKVAASWHAAGVRYLDISSHSGITRGTDWASGPDAVVELGSYAVEGGDNFTAKFFRGPYIYSVDIASGLQILRISES